MEIPSMPRGFLPGMPGMPGMHAMHGMQGNYGTHGGQPFPGVVKVNIVQMSPTSQEEDYVPTKTSSVVIEDITDIDPKHEREHSQRQSQRECEMETESTDGEDNRTKPLFDEDLWEDTQDTNQSYPITKSITIEKTVDKIVDKTNKRQPSISQWKSNSSRLHDLPLSELCLFLKMQAKSEHIHKTS
jgi:hypothetical protein